MSQQALETKNAGGEPPTTRWTIIQALAGNSAERQPALELFARSNWPSVYSFVRLKGHSPPDAEDLTQSFLLSLIELESFEGLCEAKGRFRSWLLASLSNFLRKDLRDKRRLKRGGGVADLSIDRDLGEAWLEAHASDEASPDLIFERRWAASILDRALHQLAVGYEREGRTEVAKIIAPMIAGIDVRKTYAEAGEQLGLSEGTARAAAFRMRKRLRNLIREEIAATVESPDQVDDELEHLFALFGSGPECRGGP